MTRPSRYVVIEAHLEWHINGEKVVGGAAVDLDEAADLTREPCYAIPMRLLKILTDKIQDLFSETELDLEHRFSEGCGILNSIGTFGRGFVRHPFLPPPEGPRIDEDLFRELGWDQLITHAAVEGSLRFYQEVVGPLRERLEAYLGWLTTNPTFQAECAALRTRWLSDTAYLGFIPALPVRQTLGLSSVPPANLSCAEKLVSELTDFFERWELLGLSTWDLPVPKGPNLGAPLALGALMGIQDSPAVQLPSSVRLPAETPLHELVRARPAAHLAEWADVQQQSGTLGYTRWGRLFHLHHLLNLVLADACGDRMGRRVQLLDEVLAEHFGIGEESIRKLRLQLNERLRRPAQPVAD